MVRHIQFFHVVILVLTAVLAVRQSLPLYEFSYLTDPSDALKEQAQLEKPISIQFLDTTIHYIEGDILNRSTEDGFEQGQSNDALIIALDQKILPPSPQSLSWEVFRRLPHEPVYSCDETVASDIADEIHDQVLWLRCEYKNLFLGQNIWIPLRSGALHEEGYRGLFFLGLYDYPDASERIDAVEPQVRTSIEEGLEVTLFDAKKSDYDRVFLPLLGTGKHLNLSVEAAMDSFLEAITNKVRQEQSVTDVYIVAYDGWEAKKKIKARKAFVKLTERIEAIHGGKIYHEKKKVGWFSILLLLIGLQLTGNKKLLAKLSSSDIAEDNSDAPIGDWQSFCIWFAFYLGVFSLANDLLENLFEATLLGRIVIFSVIALSPPITWLYFKEHIPSAHSDE